MGGSLASHVAHNLLRHQEAPLIKARKHRYLRFTFFRVVVRGFGGQRRSALSTTSVGRFFSLLPLPLFRFPRVSSLSSLPSTSYSVKRPPPFGSHWKPL